MTNIYILKLQKGKYYVGKTNNLEKRKQQHINGTACAWTKKYKPISVEKIIPNASDFDEDKYTKEYLTCSTDKCGIQFSKKYTSSGMPSPPVKNDAKFFAITEGLMQTRLFCMKCVTNHATVICKNSKIPIE